MQLGLTTDKAKRKEMPIARGVLDYFPNALAEVAHVSYVGNQQHNPGQEMHWARGKSADHADCVIRHLIERGEVDDDGLRHSAKAAWRALALLQIELEESAKDAEITAAMPDSEYAMTLYTDPRKNVMLTQLERQGCPLDTAQAIVDGTTFPKANDYWNGRYVYVAGPMRGYEHFNFPAFDKARDTFVQRGYAVISPADIDRATDKSADDPGKVDVTDQSRFVFRDFYAIFFLKKDGNTGNGLVLLDNWIKSTGATGEFGLARWLDLVFYEPNGMSYFASAPRGM